MALESNRNVVMTKIIFVVKRPLATFSFSRTKPVYTILPCSAPQRGGGGLFSLRTAHTEWSIIYMYFAHYCQ